MELSNEFRVGVPVSDAWGVFTDVERIAPHLPGAQLQEIDGDEFRGVVKVKVGPITAQYKGTATFVEQDEAAGRVVLRCTGRDTRGQGNANATITAVMKPDGDGTKVIVTTDLTVTGKVAQFGRGVMADVSHKLIGQFVDALEEDLREHGTAAPAATADGTTSPGEPATAPSTNGTSPKEPVTSAATTGRAAATAPVVPDAEAGNPGEALVSVGAARAAGVEPTAPSSGSPTGPRKIASPEAKPVDLFDAAGGSVAKRLLPLAGGGVLLLIVLMILRRRRG